jgi:hypothetical protein
MKFTSLQLFIGNSLCKRASMTNKITWYLLYRHKMEFTCSDFENWLIINLIDCHYIKVFPHFPWYYNLHTDTYLISELQYPFIGVLECKFNLDGLLHRY